MYRKTLLEELRRDFYVIRANGKIMVVYSKNYMWYDLYKNTIKITGENETANVYTIYTGPIRNIAVSKEKLDIPILGMNGEDEYIYDLQEYFRVCDKSRIREIYSELSGVSAKGTRVVVYPYVVERNGNIFSIYRMNTYNIKITNDRVIYAMKKVAEGKIEDIRNLFPDNQVLNLF